MTKIYPQHATAGEYHLETAFLDGTWEWWAKAARNRSLPEFAGSARTLEGAKKSAMASIGLATEANWEILEAGERKSCGIGLTDDCHL
jgi:hypothetical protein